jgi:hypothetical protein
MRRQGCLDAISNTRMIERPWKAAQAPCSKPFERDRGCFRARPPSRWLSLEWNEAVAGMAGPHISNYSEASRSVRERMTPARGRPAVIEKGLPDRPGLRQHSGWAGTSRQMALEARRRWRQGARSSRSGYPTSAPPPARQETPLSRASVHAAGSELYGNEGEGRGEQDG